MHEDSSKNRINISIFILLPEIMKGKDQELSQLVLDKNKLVSEMKVRYNCHKSKDGCMKIGLKFELCGLCGFKLTSIASVYHIVTIQL